jgi:hypothetical protein
LLPVDHILCFSRRRHCCARAAVAGPRSRQLPSLSAAVRASSSSSTPSSRIGPAPPHAVDDGGRERRRGSRCPEPGDGGDGRRGAHALGHLRRLAPLPPRLLLRLRHGPSLRLRHGPSFRIDAAPL